MDIRKRKDVNKRVREWSKTLLTAYVLALTAEYLQAIEQEILKKVLLHDKSFAEIAEEHSLTKIKVQKIYSQSLEKVKMVLTRINSEIVDHSILLTV